ncbi:MAG: hypothetical protein ACOY94_07540 [Bacillota bacterium]
MQDAQDSTKLYGIPTTARSDSFLALEWIDRNRRVRANFMALLRSLKIEIPEGTRMIIKVAQTDHEEWGSVVQLSWDADCFEPINSQGSQAGEGEELEAEE